MKERQRFGVIRGIGRRVAGVYRRAISAVLSPGLPAHEFVLRAHRRDGYFFQRRKHSLWIARTEPGDHDGVYIVDGCDRVLDAHDSVRARRPDFDRRRGCADRARHCEGIHPDENPDRLMERRRRRRLRGHFPWIGMGSCSPKAPGCLCWRNTSHARARGATILAEVAGYGSTCEAFHRVRLKECGEEPARAIRLAMRASWNCCTEMWTT